MKRSKIIEELQWCIDGVSKFANDTVWVHCEDSPNMSITVVECLMSIKESLQKVESTETTSNTAMIKCPKCQSPNTEVEVEFIQCFECDYEPDTSS